MPPKLASDAKNSATTSERTRRSRGEPRRLLIAAAQDVFNRKGYASSSTREIAETAEVSETLMFRYFGSKAGLFREAMVVPFLEVIDRYMASRLANPTRYDEPREEAAKLVSDLYDVFREHRGLAALLFAADALTESELAESGVLDEVRSKVEELVQFGVSESAAQGAAVPSSVHDLTTRTTIAMIAGMATFGTWYFGKRRPRKDVVIEELTEWVMGRFRPEGEVPAPAAKPKAGTRKRSS